MIFFDFEYINDGDNGSSRNRTYSDLVQVGFVGSDHSHGIFNVRPHHKMIPRMERLLGMTDSTFLSAMSLENAVFKMRRLSKGKKVVVFGNYDKIALLNNCNYLDNKVKKVFKSFIYTTTYLTFKYPLSDIGLNDWGYIVKSKHHGNHSALQDALVLRDVYNRLGHLDTKSKKRMDEVLKFTKVNYPPTKASGLVTPR